MVWPVVFTSNSNNFEIELGEVGSTGTFTFYISNNSVEAFFSKRLATTQAGFTRQRSPVCVQGVVV